MMPIRSNRCLYSALLLLFGLSTSAAAHSGRVALAYPLGNITLDGDLSDWPDDFVSYPIATHRAGDPPRDANDYEGSFRIGYNLEENALYLAVIMRDESIVLDGEDRVDWQFPSNRDGCTSIIHFDHKKYDETIRIVWQGVAGDKRRFLPGGTEVAFSRDAEAHYYEWRVDAGQAEGHATLYPGQVIGLMLSLWDSDADGSFTLSTWGEGDKVAPAGLSDVLLVEGETGYLTGTIQWPDQSQAGYVGIRVRPQQHPQEWVQVKADAQGTFAVELPSGLYQVEALGKHQEVELHSGASTRVALIGNAPQGRVLEVVQRASKSTGGSRQGLWQTFGLAQGLDSRSVVSMHHDRRGHMWFGAFNDLIRYDGREFVHFATPEGPLHFFTTEIIEDRQGHLWFGSYRGVFRYDGERFVHFTAEDGLLNDVVADIFEDRDGYLWFGSAGGVSRYDGERFIHFTTQEGLIEGDQIQIEQDAQGRLYFARLAGFSRYDGEKFENFRPGNPRDRRHPFDLYIDRSDHLWIAWAKGGITRFDGERFENFREINGVDIGKRWVTGIAEDHRGDMWFGSSGHGVWRYDGEQWKQYQAEDGLGTNSIGSPYKDRNEGLWFSAGESLVRYDDYRLDYLTTEDGLSSNSISTTVEDRDGHLFLGTNNEVNRYDGKTVIQYPPSASHHYWRSLYDSRGHLWFTSRSGVLRFDGKGWRIFTAEDGLVENETVGIAEDRDGNIWVARSGLSRFDGQTWTSFTVADGLASNKTGDLAFDDQGRLWIGRLGGVDRFDGKEFVHFDLGKDFTFGITGAVYRDRDGNMWFGSRGGLVRFDGKEWTHFTTEDGLLLSSIKALWQDRRGRLWIGGPGSGVALFDGLVFQHLLQPDGLASNQVSGIIERQNGQIAIATRAGLTLYRPSTTPPTIRLAGVIADRDYGVVDSLEISSSQNYLRFGFEGTSLLTPPERMAYVYRLRGVEEKWQVSRDEYVEYGALPLGDYTFEVKAVDRDLNYSAPVAVALKVYHRPFASPVYFDSLHVEDLFASFYPTYAEQPFGTVRVVNETSQAVEATFRFALPGLMRQPVEEALVLQPRSSQEIALRARLDPAILQIEQTRLVQAELELEFEMGDQITAIKQKPEITLYGRGALQWDDVARAAAFITASDKEVASFARQSLVAFEDEIQARGKPLANLTRALVFFEALKAHGLRYLADANSPYAQATSDRSVIDYIQYPAELLKSKSGDCDDLTVLYASLLENAGVPTALVDYPGHIFLLFDTGVARQEAYKLPMEARRYVVRGDRVWIPVEITRLDEPFAVAWKQGLDELARLSERDRRRLVVDTAVAWTSYPPTNPIFGDEVEVPERSVYAEALTGQHDGLVQQIDQYIEDHYLDILEREPDNEALRSELGKVYVALRQYDTAIDAAYSYLRSPGGKRASTYNHLGIVSYFKGELQQAAFFLQQALDLAPEDEGIRRNLEKVRAELGEVEAGARTTAMVELAVVGAKGAAVGEDEDSFYWIK